MSKPEYVESWLNNADNKRGWSGSQVRLTRLELTIYRTEHFRPLAPNPSTPPRAAPRDLFFFFNVRLFSFFRGEITDFLFPTASSGL